MSDVEALSARLRTVEQAVTDGECSFPEATELSEIETRLGAAEDRIEELEASVDELDAAIQALRGYVGNVRSVNEDVEQRADAALAATERLEARLEDRAPGTSSHETDTRPTPGERRPAGRPAQGDAPTERGSLRESVDGSAEGATDVATAIENESETGTEQTKSGVLARVRRLL